MYIYFVCQSHFIEVVKEKNEKEITNNESNKYLNGLMLYLIYYYQVLFCFICFLLLMYVNEWERITKGWFVKVSESLQPCHF